MESPLKELILEYEQSFGDNPKFIASASGRVVMIGDHIDYNNYGVLTFCIDRDMKIAIGNSMSSSNMITLRNTSDKFEEHLFPKLTDICIKSPHTWVNYVMASFIGLCEYVVSDYDITKVGNLYKDMQDDPAWVNQLSVLIPNPVNILVQGSIPMGSGISSSSALVVSTMLALISKIGMDLNRTTIAEICAIAERHIGTQGGGMDQATMCFSEDNSLLHITFNPLVHKTMNYPNYISIYLCHLLIEEHKAKTVAVHFNKRVFECKIGAIILLKSLFPKFKIIPNNYSMYHYQFVQEKSGLSFSELLEKINTIFSLRAYSKEFIENFLGCDILSKILEVVGFDVWYSNESFEIQKRARHVFSEAWRVNRFIDICSDSSRDEDIKIKDIGDIINESFYSEEYDFECGCEQTGPIRKHASALNTIGSRIIGAGWGGYMAFFIKPTDAKRFEQHMIQYYLNNNIPISKISETYLFQVSACKGLKCYQIHGGEATPVKINN